MPGAVRGTLRGEEVLRPPFAARSAPSAVNQPPRCDRTNRDGRRVAYLHHTSTGARTAS